MVLRSRSLRSLWNCLKWKAQNVLSVKIGQLAVETFTASEENTINLILMDVQMPVMNGYEAMKAIEVQVIRC